MPASRPATVVVNKVDKKGVVTDVVVPKQGRIRKKEQEKMEKNQRLTEWRHQQSLCDSVVSAEYFMGLFWCLGMWSLQVQVDVLSQRSRWCCQDIEERPGLSWYSKDRPRKQLQIQQLLSIVENKTFQLSSSMSSLRHWDCQNYSVLSFWPKTSKAKSTVGRCIPEETKPTWVAMKALSWCCECQRLPFNSSGGLANMSPQGFSY